jgi:SAM-dependent methyltransferase
VINGMLVQGQRDPRARLALVPVDLHGKSVLDIGSNQGGMLFALEQPKWGVGIDFDSRMVNVANRLRDAGKHHALNFFVFDLEKEPLALIHDFLPEPKVDVAFLLSVCMWLKNWREVVDFAASVSEAMLFETNGTDRQQTEQEEHLRGIYRKITTLAAASDDDPKQKRRKLLYCEDCRLSDRR